VKSDTQKENFFGRDRQPFLPFHEKYGLQGRIKVRTMNESFFEVAFKNSILQWIYESSVIPLYLTFCEKFQIGIQKLIY
jgi:hypothetical protein